MVLRMPGGNSRRLRFVVVATEKPKWLAERSVRLACEVPLALFGCSHWPPGTIRGHAAVTPARDSDGPSIPETIDHQFEAVEIGISNYCRSPARLRTAREIAAPLHRAELERVGPNPLPRPPARGHDRP